MLRTLSRPDRKRVMEICPIKRHPHRSSRRHMDRHALLGTVAPAIAVICVAGLGLHLPGPARSNAPRAGLAGAAVGLDGQRTRSGASMVTPQTSSRTASAPVNPYPGEEADRINTHPPLGGVNCARPVQCSVQIGNVSAPHDIFEKALGICPFRAPRGAPALWPVSRRPGMGMT